MLVVDVVISQHGSRPTSMLAEADAEGAWSIAERVLLPNGDWEIRARAKKDSEFSEWTQPRVFKSVVTGINIGNITFKYVTLAAILIGIIAIVGALFIYSIIRVRKLKSQLLLKETREAKQKVIDGFRAIRSDIIDELKTMEAQAAAGSLDMERLTQKERLLRELHTLEDSIARELEDVERVS